MSSVVARPGSTPFAPRELSQDELMVSSLDVISPERPNSFALPPWSSELTLAAEEGIWSAVTSRHSCSLLVLKV